MHEFPNFTGTIVVLQASNNSAGAIVPFFKQSGFFSSNTELMCCVVHVNVPEVRGEGLGSYSSFTGCLGSELLSSQEAVEAVEDAGQTHCFPPQGGRDGVDGTELWNQDLKNTTHCWTGTVAVQTVCEVM